MAKSSFRRLVFSISACIRHADRAHKLPGVACGTGRTPPLASNEDRSRDALAPPPESTEHLKKERLWTSAFCRALS